MRLIDADKLIEKFEELEKHFEECSEIVDGRLRNPQRFWDTMQGCIGGVIDCQITLSDAEGIKAIPIEFIKKYYEDITMPHTDTRIQFEELIRKWEEENE